MITANCCGSADLVDLADLMDSLVFIELDRSIEHVYRRLRGMPDAKIFCLTKIEQSAFDQFEIALLLLAASAILLVDALIDTDERLLPARFVSIRPASPQS